MLEVKLPFGFRKGDDIFDLCEVRGLTGKEATLLHDNKKQASLMRDILNACVVRVFNSDGKEYKELREAVNGFTTEDRDCILITIRRATWNDDNYIHHSVCPSCNKSQSCDINITTTTPIEYGPKVFQWEKEVLGYKVAFKLLTVKEEIQGNIELLDKIEKEAKQELLKNAKMSPEQQQIMVRIKMNELLNISSIFQEHLAKIVVSVDGNPVRGLTDIQDMSLPLIQELGDAWIDSKPQGGANLELSLICHDCGEKYKQHLFEANGSAVGLSGIVHFFGIKPPTSAATQ